MGGLSGTGDGLSADASAPNDLEIAYRGGKGFLDRLAAIDSHTSAMEAQKTTAARALAALDLGNDIVATQKAAQAALADAQNKALAAEKKLAETHANCAKITNEAQAQAKTALDAANGSAQQIQATAAVVKKNADDYAADAKGKADAALATATQTLADAGAKSIAMDLAKKQAEDAKAAHEAAMQTHIAAKKEYDAKVAKIVTILNTPIAGGQG
jgi:hypothetical protein